MDLLEFIKVSWLIIEIFMLLIQIIWNWILKKIFQLVDLSDKKYKQNIRYF